MATLTEELLKEGLITGEQLEDARDKQIGAKKPLQELLVEMGFLGEEDLVRVSSKLFNMQVEELREGDIDPDAIKMLPYEKAKRYGVLPLRIKDGALVLATSDPEDVIALEDLQIIAGMAVKPVLSTRSAITEFTEKAYQSDESIYDLLKNVVSGSEVKIISAKDEKGKAVDIEKLETDNSPVIRLVDLIFSDAVKSRASDIHIEPQETVTEVRYRIDGDLRRIMEVPAKLHSALTARIKIISDLDIAEKRKPQDGRTRIIAGENKYDVRVSTVPTFHGETVVMRLLDTKGAIIDLDYIGFGKEDLDLFKEEVSRPQGMILVTGPTGSGKTSTLYAALNHVNSEDKKIITVEDPIEYLLEGVNQIQIDPVKNVTFATGLRSILRQDPNVILVGEIRDRETADIAFRAALTGHLVFSTLHTNSAAATVTRLLDIGLEPYLIASSLVLVLAQRLVRRICPHCRTEYTPDGKLLERFGPYIRKYGAEKFHKGSGCEKCGYTGFLGRTALTEIMPVDEEMKALINDKAPEDDISRKAREKGMKTIAESGVELAARGVTTLEEVAKVADGLEIPAMEAASRPAAPPEAPAAEKKIREKPLLLVVDDEDDIRKVLQKRLEMADYDVVSARNGREGVEAAVRAHPDLIVMDIMMPEMNGIEATRTLRSSLETAGIPVVMLTAKKDKETELKGIDAGADDYITKPYDKDKLLARIAMLLRRTKGRG